MFLKPDSSAEIKTKKMKTVSLKVYYVTIKFEEQFEHYILSMQKNNNTVKIG